MEVIVNISIDEISNFIDTIVAAGNRSSSIYFIGNGGSAATASHFVNDILIGTKSIDNPFRAISLCDNQAVITAIGNDYGYEDTFSRYIKAWGEKGDQLVAFSTSGESKNVLKKMYAVFLIIIGIISFKYY